LLHIDDKGKFPGTVFVDNGIFFYIKTAGAADDAEKKKKGTPDAMFHVLFFIKYPQCAAK